VQSAICFKPDASITNRANGVWGYPTADALQLSPYSYNSALWAVTYANRGLPEIWGIQVNGALPIAWTVEAPDGTRWQSNWQLVP
jgi:hypothetical protein